jgi:hypothetical protein
MPRYLASFKSNKIIEKKKRGNYIKKKKLKGNSFSLQ